MREHGRFNAAAGWVVVGIFGLGFASPAEAFTCLRNETPNTFIDSGPSGTVASTTATFGFSASCTPVTYQCKLDGGAYASCTTPKTYTGLSQGSHTFSVRAANGGLVDLSPATRTWTVDTVVPNTTITSSPPSPTSNATLQFSFTATEAVLRFDCSLDAATWSTCVSPASMTAADGLHEFRVRAVDFAGNTDATPAFVDVLVNAEVCQ